MGAELDPLCSHEVSSSYGDRCVPAASLAVLRERDVMLRSGGIAETVMGIHALEAASESKSNRIIIRFLEC